MSEIRYVTVPRTITITVENHAGGAPILAVREFEKFVIERTNDAEVFGKSLDGIMMGLGIRQAFLGSKPGDIVGLELAQWDALCKATHTPTGGYNPVVMMQLVEHAQAVIDAPSKRPEAPALAEAAE